MEIYIEGEGLEPRFWTSSGYDWASEGKSVSTRAFLGTNPEPLLPDCTSLAGFKAARTASQNLAVGQFTPTNLVTIEDGFSVGQNSSFG